MGDPWGRWLAGGLREHKRTLVRARASLRTRRAVPEEARQRGVASYNAIIAEIDARIRELETTRGS